MYSKGKSDTSSVQYDVLSVKESRAAPREGTATNIPFVGGVFMYTTIVAYAILLAMLVLSFPSSSSVGAIGTCIRISMVEVL